MENEKISALIKEIEAYIQAFDQFLDFQEIPEWKSIFISIAQKVTNIFQSELDWEVKMGALTEILYFFAPRMGSFREDCPNELYEKSQNLTSATFDCLRFCWMMAGHETNSIPQNELFQVGEKVNLVKGQLMVLGFAGYKDIADFEEIHTYEIIENTGNDISNMPTYNIKFGTCIRNARHNSLVRAGT